VNHFNLLSFLSSLAPKDSVDNGHNQDKKDPKPSQEGPTWQTGWEGDDNKKKRKNSQPANSVKKYVVEAAWDADEDGANPAQK